ncbi:hypothetical protein GWI33_004963 [Rhynchophorus ferrugineus]|uniref:Uncharacterized protein n=1 Tax=Rhynchophorus ferrugineus TaxID=354439 RepID=A0A834II52_RHYFE|nr:hypothetical protein GWI33_004963 [Rhynchophorus ferrugineus]
MLRLKERLAKPTQHIERKRTLHIGDIGGNRASAVSEQIGQTRLAVLTAGCTVLILLALLNQILVVCQARELIHRACHGGSFACPNV